MAKTNDLILPYAEDVNYFKTSKTSSDAWLQKARNLIEGFDGRLNSQGYVLDARTGKQAFMFSFNLGGEDFKIVFPVLPVKTAGNENAARIQAATLIYHDVKAKLMMARIFGARLAFFNYLLLPDGSGRTMSELATPDLVDWNPQLLLKEVSHEEK